LNTKWLKTMENNLQDYIIKVEGFNKIQTSEMIDFFSYYLLNIAGQKNLKPKDIEKCFETLNIPPYSNIPKYLTDNSQKVKGKIQKFIKKDVNYVLTNQRIEALEKRINLDMPKQIIEKVLRELLPKIANANANSFLEEGIKTFEIGAYRASIIMIWLLTLDHMFEYVIANKLPDFNVALRQSGIAKTINSKDDFGEIKESKFIEVCRGANIISNDVRKILSTKLGIRNSFAHPSTVMLPKSKALEFIEDLVENVILKY
jgi:hypothetical protein